MKPSLSSLTMDMPDLFEDDHDADKADPGDPLEDLMLELIDEISLGLCFDIHRTIKIGTYMLDITDSREDEFSIVSEKGLDVFGQLPMKKQVECVCPNCNRNIAASRFAPHLEKCMGMGRNSSRIASRRIANANANAKKDSDNESEQDDDNDWSYAVDRKVKKLKKDKNNHSGSPRRGKNSKHRNGSDIPSVGSTKSDDSGHHLPHYESMSLEERKALLLSTCGVISEHTKKMCTRSSRCPQHTDEQRRAVRHYFLGHTEQDDVVDIDTYNDADGQALRDSLQWEAVSNPSPAGSASSVSKKRKHGKVSKKKSKSSSVSSSRVATPPGSVLLGYLTSK